MPCSSSACSIGEDDTLLSSPTNAREIRPETGTLPNRGRGPARAVDLEFEDPLLEALFLRAEVRLRHACSDEYGCGLAARRRRTAATAVDLNRRQERRWLDRYLD